MKSFYSTSFFIHFFALIMNAQNSPAQPSSNKAATFNDATFTPKGALTFFVGMIIMFAIMWFGLYFDLLRRAANQ